MGTQSKVCVLLWHYGSPAAESEIREFLRGVVPASKLETYTESYVRKYRYVGGSPQNREVDALALKLSTLLERAGLPARVSNGTKHWKPSFRDSVVQAVRDGYARITVVPLVPFASNWLLKEYREAVADSQHNLGSGAEIRMVPPYCFEPEFIDGWANEITAAHTSQPIENTGSAVVLSFHAIPLVRLTGDETYLKETRELANAISSKLTNTRTELAFQSAATTSLEWSKPSIVERIVALSEQGYKKVTVAPVGFVYDHLETVFDIDVVLWEASVFLGVDVTRVPAPGSSQWFAHLLCRLILETLGPTNH
jgi:ferrochelatase